MADDAMKGITGVTFSAKVGGEELGPPVTITPEQFQNLSGNIRRSGVRHEPQMDMGERQINDGQLHALLSNYFATRASHKAFEKAKRGIKKLMETRTPGVYRCGEYTLTVSPLDGGGFEVPEWHTNVIRLGDE